MGDTGCHLVRERPPLWWSRSFALVFQFKLQFVDHAIVCTPYMFLSLEFAIMSVSRVDALVLIPNDELDVPICHPLALLCVLKPPRSDIEFRDFLDSVRGVSGLRSRDEVS
jgi:hypothetical protein